jgi:preprotein translocase subunit SecE
VARNRKRGNQRRARRPPQAADPRPGFPTATEPSFVDEHELEANGAPDRLDEHDASDPLEEHGAPDPLEHAAPDVELAEEQLAYGRPEELEPDDEADEEEFELEVEESIKSRGGGRRGRGGGGNGGYDGESGGELAVPGPRHVEARENLLVRMIGFLQGSWRELQRVQWPDRRQVMQATGVVIGFVIVAAAFLGASDWVAGKLVTFILK